MMNPWVKRKWVKALRSGEYRQGRSRLKQIWNRKIEYCCLGVLVEECAPEFFSDGAISETGSYTLGPDRAYGFIPDDLAIMWELTKDEQIQLSDLNDKSEDKFPAIADWIEANL